MKIIESLKIVLSTLLIAIGSFFGGQSFKDNQISPTEAAVFQEVKDIGFQDVFVREDKGKLTIRFEVEQLDSSLLDQMIEAAARASQTKTRSDQIVVQSYFLREPFFGLKISKQKIEEYAADQISAEELLKQIEFEDLRSTNSKLSTNLSVFNFTVDNLDVDQQKAELDLSYQQPAVTANFETTFWNDYLALISTTLKDCPSVDKIVTNIELFSNTKKLVISAESKDIISFLDESISPDQFGQRLTISEEKVIESNTSQENSSPETGSAADTKSQAANTFQEVLASYYQALKHGDYQQAASYLSPNLSGYWADEGGEAVVTSYDILYIKEETEQKAVVYVEELLVGYDNSTALNYLDYTLVKDNQTWKIDEIKEVEKNINSTGAGAQTNQGQLTTETAISTVGNFLNSLKRNKPQEAKLYATTDFVTNQTPGLFTEYTLFNELEVITAEASGDSVLITVRETWSDGTAMASYQVISSEQGTALVSARKTVE